MSISSLPILFIIFNRPETALKSFESIREFKPQQLFIACDGPRFGKNGESELVNRTRNEILNSIDWDCDVKTLFQERNLGCRLGVYTAINWFFENIEYGIILEDDCVAQQSFFKYAYEMLTYYKDDDRIGMIAGFNPIKLNNYPYSYIFSKFKSCWGWATWRRAWNNMDLNMNWRESIFAKSIIANSGYHNLDKSKWKFEIKCLDNDVVSAWDWQWYFTLASQNQLCIYPSVNQISNIGNTEDATHTGLSNIVLPSFNMKFPLIKPDYCVPYEPFDYLFYKRGQTLKAKLSRALPSNLKKKIKKLIVKIK